MNKENFVTEAYAKCILVGEHAVLRGYPALIVPVKEKLIKFSYKPSISAISLECDSLFREQVMLLFWDTFKHGLSLLKKDFSLINGNFYLKNNIPIGAGIGFSSALCVIISQFFIWKKWLEKNKLFEFARKLEHRFHGISSGIDIIGSMSKQCIHFSTKNETYKIKLNWQPKLYLSFSESYKTTADSVSKVNALTLSQPELANHLYNEMADSTSLVENSLGLDYEQGFTMLVQGLNKAYQCFQQWGLINEQMQNHVNVLQKLGAVAVKPTGAGGGGYILSLWKDTPNSSAPFKLISIF